MSLHEGIYKFYIDLNNSRTGNYCEIRATIPKHPYDSFGHLYARLLSFAHSYHSGLELSAGSYDLDKPSAWSCDSTGEIQSWIEVGEIDPKKLERATKRNPQARFAVYFYTPEQLHKFCHGLRGSRTNWVKPIEFYLIDSALIDKLGPPATLRSRWQLTIVDDALFLSTEQSEFSTSLVPLDIWHHYQEHIRNINESG